MSKEIEYLREKYDSDVQSLDKRDRSKERQKVPVDKTGRKSSKPNRKLSSAQNNNKNEINSNNKSTDVEADTQANYSMDERGNDDSDDKQNDDDPAKRLRELEEMMVGGEQAHNEELKKKRIKKKKYAEERKRLLAEALKNGDDEEFMLRVYDSVQEEVKFKSKLLEKEAEKVKFLENEVKDLHREFEEEREEYLDTIRKMEKQNKLLVKILQRIQPIISHDCNYYNLDRIQSLATWNEEKEEWSLPELKREKLSLPSMSNGGDISSHHLNSATSTDSSVQNGRYHNQMNHEPELDRYRLKLENSNYNESKNYFKNKRQAELLNQTHDLRQNLTINNGRLSPIRNGFYDQPSLKNTRNKK